MESVETVETVGTVETVETIETVGGLAHFKSYQQRSLSDRSSLLKTPKTRKIKTHLTQNFELV